MIDDTFPIVQCGACGARGRAGAGCAACGNGTAPVHRPRRGRRRLAPIVLPVALVAAVGLVALVAVSAPIAWSPSAPARHEPPAPPSAAPPSALSTPPPYTPPHTPPIPEADAAAQAAAIDALLSESQDSRTALQPALNEVAQCAAGALATIREITRQREDQWERARELPVDALAGGVELRDALTEALRASYEADVGFQSWARRHLDLGCQGDPDADPDYQWALDRSGAAEAAKDRFAALWQPIADAYGLPRRTASSI